MNWKQCCKIFFIKLKDLFVEFFILDEEDRRMIELNHSLKQLNRSLDKLHHQIHKDTDGYKNFRNKLVIAHRRLFN